MTVRDYEPGDNLRCNLIFSASLGAYDPRPAKQASDVYFLRGLRRLRVAYDDDGRILVVEGARREVLDHLRDRGFAFYGEST